MSLRENIDQDLMSYDASEENVKKLKDLLKDKVKETWIWEMGGWVGVSGWVGKGGWEWFLIF